MHWTDPDTGEKHKIVGTEAFLREIREFQQAVCVHDKLETRIAKYANNTTAIRNQCMICGELVGSAISKSKVMRPLLDVDVELRKNHEIARRTSSIEIYRRHIREQATNRQTFRDLHAQYLRSPKWAKLRSAVLKRAGGMCEGCGEERATQVHHLSYAHWRDELLFELVAVCNRCHDRCHSDDEEAQLLDTAAFGEDTLDLPY